MLFVDTIQDDTTLVVDISVDGCVESLYKDGLNLDFLGNQHIYRQAEIVFDYSTQDWGVFYCGKNSSSERHYPARVFGGFSSYEKARKFEVAWLNSCRLHSIAPDSERGIELASYVRVTLV